MIKRSTPDKIIEQWMEITRLLRHRMLSLPKAKFMNPLQMHAMMMIRENKGLTMTEFAKCLHVTTPSATSLANRLVKMKLVQRVSDPKNRKLVRLKLSHSGMAALTKKLRDHTRMMRDLFALLPRPDQREFARILGTLRKTLASAPHRQ